MPQTTRALEILDHPIRRQALQIVSDSPGVHLQDLVDQLEAPPSTVQYHVQVLEDEHILQSERHGKYRCYFPNNARYDERERARLAALANPTTAMVVAHLRSEPGSHQAGIADELGRKPSTIHDHLARLKDVGLVETQPDGNAVRYFLDPEPSEIEHLPEPSN